MKNNTAKLVARVEPFKEGDSRTPFSAETINEIVTALNALLAMKGTGGIRIYKADAGFVIDGSHTSGSSSSSGSIGPGGDTYINCVCRYA